MSPNMAKPSCEQAELVSLYALRSLPASEVTAMEEHLVTCLECREQLAELRPVVDCFAASATDLLRPSQPLWERISRRLAPDVTPMPAPQASTWSDPEWEQVAPGISCSLLATDTENHRVSLLVRLAPGIEYPPHRHAGVEELHLLHGELWIGDTKLYPGDYNRGEPATEDRRVWSETGCTCVLITSTRDVLL